MGHGIAQIMAQGGKDVILNDISSLALNNAKHKIEASIRLLVTNDLFPESKIEETLDKIKYSNDISCVADADLIF